MACFIVPMTEAIVTTVVTKVMEKKAEKSATEHAEIQVGHKHSFTKKLNMLNGLLWGGSALLAFEHLWHGEIQPFFPFITAASDPTAFVDVLKEMATVGVGMAVLVTAVWGIIVGICHVVETRTEKDDTSVEI